MMSLDKCRKMIMHLYSTKRSADKVDDKAGATTQGVDLLFTRNNRALLDDYAADFMRNHWGVLAELLARLRYEYRRGADPFICQFVCLVGLYDPQPPVAHWVIVKAGSPLPNQ
eukprot:scaffold647825_cov40-Prasinocladus_malaysianus.AAC.3